MPIPKLLRPFTETHFEIHYSAHQLISFTHTAGPLRVAGAFCGFFSRFMNEYQLQPHKLSALSPPVTFVVSGNGRVRHLALAVATDCIFRPVADDMLRGWDTGIASLAAPVAPLMLIDQQLCSCIITINLFLLRQCTTLCTPTRIFTASREVVVRKLNIMHFDASLPLCQERPKALKT